MPVMSSLPTYLTAGQWQRLLDLPRKYQDIFTQSNDDLHYNNLVAHKIHSEDSPHIASPVVQVSHP